MSESSTQVWRVLIHFQEKKVTYMAHIPTEVQQRGYHKDRLYPPDPYRFELHHLQLSVDAVTAREAEAKAKQLLLDYVQMEWER